MRLEMRDEAVSESRDVLAAVCAGARIRQPRAASRFRTSTALDRIGNTKSRQTRLENAPVSRLLLVAPVATKDDQKLVP